MWRGSSFRPPRAVLLRSVPLLTSVGAFAFCSRPVLMQERSSTSTAAPKRIALLGATGGTGRHVLLLALARGHQVAALARDPSRLPKLPVHDPTQLRVVQGDCLQLESVQQLVRNTDVVISCVGARSRGDTIMTSLVGVFNSSNT